MRTAAKTFVFIVMLALLLSMPRLARAQSESVHDRALPTLSTDAVQHRFLAAHGRRSVVMGYEDGGLEIWGYPFQILSGFAVGFRPVGTTSATSGEALLRRIDYAPDSITRVYIGPDYLVRETIFVPLDQAAASITYEVEGARQLDIGIHFSPVMNLMWPGAVGGQYTRWQADLPGYLITEPEHGFAAAVTSPEIVAHDETGNNTVAAQANVSFTLRTGPSATGISRASMAIVLLDPKTSDRISTVHAFAASVAAEKQSAASHYRELEHSALAVTTPDEGTNQAIGWAEIALDQAWVCNPSLGCGLVAGYGPLRDARRPQYAWFFAGDGLVATNALVSAGEYTRAREELAFVLRYQQPKTGMIWHELSQSAGYIDWSKYPYMYVHVDITADFLAALARYVVVSGDVAFARERWPSILMAHRYLESLMSGSSGLPKIPRDKEGGDEQARPADDLALSAGVLAAERGFAQLAALTGQPELARKAETAGGNLRAAIAARYWNATTQFWIDGHTADGAAIAGRRKGPMALLNEDVFSPEQAASIFTQLAPSEFRADWGLREVATASPDYDPYSYGRGSITALGTMQAAVAFWKGHRPAVGQAIWNGALPWQRLDSLGHVHEVFAGSFYEAQAESVPEQTWSSAGVLDAAIRGLLGLEVRGAQNEISFAPHLPADWDHVSVGNIRLPHGTLALAMTQSATAIDLTISNEAGATTLVFAPEIPLGAGEVTARFAGRSQAVKTERHPGDEHGSVTLAVPPGVSRCHMEWKGGIRLVLRRSGLRVGDPSTDLKITRYELRSHTLTLEADVLPGGTDTLELRTACKLASQTGVLSTQLPQGYTVRFPVKATAGQSPLYEHRSGELTFEDCGAGSETAPSSRKAPAGRSSERPDSP